MKFLLSTKKLLLLTLFAVTTTAALADDIKLINPFPAGGLADKMARIIIRYANTSEYNFVQEFKLGAGSVLGYNYIASQKTGTVIGIAANPLVVAPLFDKLATYNIETDFQFISLLGVSASFIVVNTESKIDNFKQLVEISKNNSIFYGTSGIGTSGYLTAVTIADANPNWVHVPFKGATETIAAVLGKNITWTQESDSVISPFIKAGKLKAIATVYPRRVPGYMDIPTLRELGLKDFGIYRWFILMANSSADPKIIAHLKQVMQRPEVKKELEELGSDPDYKFTNTFLRDETRKIQKVLSEYKIER